MHTTRATSRKDSLASLRRKALPLSLSLLLCGALASTPAQAGGGVGRTTTPTGGVVIGGSGSILQDGANVVINQASDKLVLNWQSFNLGQDALVRFNQPGTSAVALNRILDQNASQIFGQISSNGQVFLINTHGIIFGSTAQVNVGGLVASTLDLTPTDFLSNHFNLNAVGGGAGIVNHGTLAAASGGSISLIGGSVANDGVILANYGRINLDGAEHAVLDFDGNGLINVQITGELKQRLDAKAAVSNAGTLQADGGTVVLEAAAARDLFTNLVNNSGVIDAGAISHDGGVVRLVARGGDTVNSGRIDATGAQGGSIQLLSDRNVGVTGGSIDASGTYDGGDIRVGGGWQGGEGLQTADAVYVADDATLKADTTRNGDGGSVVVWGNHVNNFYGSISARGGANGGDGGRVETSSHDGLNAQGHVDASAAHGKMGSWLLDPYSVTISSAADSKTSSGPIYTPNGNNSVVNAGGIGTALTGGTSVYVFTNTAGGSQNGDITVDAPITASGAGQLYLQAYGSIYVNDNITAAAGQSLDVHLWANYAGTGGANTYTKGSCTTACVVTIGDTAAATIDTHGGLVDILTSGAVRIGNSTNTATIKATTLTIGSATNKVGSIREGTNGSIAATTVNARSNSSITLANGGNAIGTANLYGGTTQITDSTDLVLGTVATGNLTATTTGTLAFGGGTINGNLTATSSGDISQSGALTVTGTSNFSAGTGLITLTQANNDFQDAVSLSGGAAQITDKNALVLDAVSTDGLAATSTGALSLGTGTVSGNLAATSNNGAITQASGGLAVTGTSIIDAGTGDVTLTDAGNDFSGIVTLTGGTTQIASNGALSLGALDTGDLTVDSGDVLVFAGGNVDGNLDAAAAGNISQSGALDVTGTSRFASGSGTITLTQSANAFGGAVSLTGGAAQITSGGALTLGTLATTDLTATSTGALDLGQGTVDGALAATSNDGAITQDGALAVTGTSTLDAGTGAITLAEGGNIFTGAVSATGSDVSLQSSGDLTVAALTSGTDGSVSLVAGGSLFLPTMAIDTGLGDLTLAANGGSLGINGNLSGANVSLASSSGLTLAYDVIATGTLSLASSTGAISQTAGTLDVGGTSAIDAAGDITLTGSANNFQDAVSLSGGDVQINGAGALALGTLATGDLTVTSTGALTLGTGTVGGNLVATSGGAIDQASGGLAVSGTSSIDAGTHAITLTDTGNDFGGAVSLTGAAVAITDSNALALGTLATGALTVTSTGALDLGQGTIGGGLSATSNDGAISQSGGLTVSGSSDIDAGAGAITLDNAANSFAGTVSLTGGATRLTSSGNLALGTLATGDLTVVSAGTLGFAGGSVGGNLDATSTGAISQTGALDVSGTSSFDAGTGAITLTQANNEFGGAVSLTGGTTQIVDRNALVLGTLATGDLTATSHGTLNLGKGSIGGNLVAASNGGAITQATGGLAVGGSTAINAGSGAITLNDAANDFVGSVNLTGGATRITDANALSLGTLSTANLTAISHGALNLGSGTVGGNLTATSNDGAISQAGGLTVNGTSAISAGNAAIALTAPGNDFIGAVSLSNSGANNVALDNGTNALVLGTSNVGSGTLSLAGGGVSQVGGISQAVGAGAVTLTAGGGALVLGDAGNDFTGTVDAQGTSVSLRTLGDLHIVGMDVATNGSLSLVAGGALDLASFGAINTGTGDLTLSAGAGLATSADLSGHNVSLTGGTGLTLSGNVNASGTLYLGSTNAAISQTAGVLFVAGATTVDAGSGTVTLASIGNDFQGAVSLTGGATQIVDANALTLGTLATGNLTATSTGNLGLGKGTVAGTLQATSNGGAISQASGGLTVTGASTLDAGSGAITLADGNNNFVGTVSLTGGTAQITDRNALSLGTLATAGLTATSTGALDLGAGTINGNLVASSNGGAVTQTGALTIGGTSNIDAGNGAITLANVANDFGGAVSLAGGVTQLVDANALTLGTLDTAALTVASTGALNLGNGTVAGNLSATSNGGAISQSGALTVTGASTLDAGAGAITLTKVSNNFVGAVTLIGGTTQIVDENALTLAAFATGNLSASSTGTLNLGNSSIGGNLSTSSNGGAIIQSGALSVAGTSAIDAGSGSITLTNATNDFAGAVSLAGGATQIVDANALTLGALATGTLAVSNTGALNLGSGFVGANLSANSHGGAISQGGALAVTGTSTIDAGSGTIILTNASNDFTGAVSLIGGTSGIYDRNALTLGTLSTGALSATSTGALNLGGGSVGGSLVASSNGGAISQSGALAVTGVSAINAGSGAITLTNATNDFTGALSLTGGTTRVTDANALTLGTLATGTLTASNTGALNLGSGSIGGNLSATSNGGAISQTGALAVTGTSAIDAGSSAVTLTNASNNFVGAVSLVGGAAQIVDLNALTLGTLATGNLDVTSTGNLGLGKGTVAGTLRATSNGGAISQASGGLTVTGASTLDAGSGAITLADSNNEFGAVVNLGGNNVQITDRNDLSLGTLATGSLTATSTGALNLGAGSIGGNLVAVSNGGAITQSGALTVSGTSNIDAGNGAITLTKAANDFSDAVSLAGGITQLVDANALILGTLNTGTLTIASTGALNLGNGTVGGNLSATSNGGAIGQSGALIVTGGSTLDAGTGSITLANAGNDFQGTVGLTGAGLSVRDANDLTIGPLAAAANDDIRLVAGGSLVLPVSAIDTGTGDLVLAANGGTLGTKGTLSGANVSLSGRDGLTLAHDVTATVRLTLNSAAGAVTQTAGVVTAATLTGSAFGNATLGRANAISALSSFSANGLLLRTKGGLTINGAVVGGGGGLDIGSGGLLKVAAGISGDDITLQGAGISQSAGSIDAGTGQLELTSSAGIAQTGGSITAGTLIGDATGGVSLAGANRLDRLGSFDAANLSLTNAEDLVLVGPVTTSGAASLTIGGDLAINGTLAAASTSLDVDGAISEGTSGNIVTGTLSGQASGNVSLVRNNHVGALGNFAAANFALTNAQALAVNGSLDVGAGSITLTTITSALSVNSALNGGSIALDSAGNLVLGKAIKANTLSLKSAGSISQTASGLITAGTLSGQSAGATTLNQANAISTLGNFSANVFSLTSTKALTVAGTVDGGASTALASGGNLRINGIVKGGATDISGTGTISEGTSGNIVANTLTGKATGAVTLNGLNHIGTLGNFQAAGFSLYDAQNLRVSGTVDGGASTMLDIAGNLVIGGAIEGTSTRLNVAGALSENGGGRIVADALVGHVTGSASLTGNNAVGSLGNLDAAGLSFTNTNALTIAGTVDGGASTTLTTKAGGLTIDGALAGSATTLHIAGSIDQSGQSRITAGTLTGEAGSDVALDGDNRVDKLGGFSANEFRFSNGKALEVAGALTANGGAIELSTGAGELAVNASVTGDTIALGSAGDLALAQGIHGGRVTLASGGTISQSAGGIITADSLSGHSAGSTTLDQANAIGALDGFSASGLTITTKRALTVTGTVDGGGSTTLTTGGNLAINGSLTGDTTTLAVTGNISEGSPGSITAHTLTGQASGAVALTGANRLDTLGEFSADGFTLTNGPSLTVTGPVDGGASVNLTTTRGDLLINGKVSGRATRLVSAGAITEGQGGSIVADTLSGQAGGYTQLGTASSPLANYIGTLGGFSSTAGFSLTNAQTLTLASVGGSTYTVDAGTSSLYLGVTGGDLLQIGTTWLYDGEGTFASTGRIGTSDAPIYVTGTGPQAVAFVGLPPAYFYAVNSAGNLLPLTGGDSVNVPTSLFTSRAQNANNHTDVYIDPSVISANYRSFGIVPSGILLPADQQACDPEMEECDE
ncbi:filamentous hemagglutinin N-terminal domain-containing protein [Frateuria sp. GZRe14]|uniref:filamentous hemagglutinin N-terminal domain-containing protein n=1 Tax=Frateuria sp. GZRe14 TaxID=3351534 RepID=UPI003EDC6842